MVASTVLIAAERLVFTPKQPWSEFVTNCQLADLFLDTFNYSAGATDICALQAGLPVLTCPGQTYASRMGASICGAAGLESLICDSPQTYVQQAVALAQEPERLQSLRDQLQHHKDQLPLFQPQAWMAHLESVLQQLWQDYVVSHNTTAESFTVVDSDDASGLVTFAGNSRKPKVQYRGLQNLTVEQSLAYNELTFPKLQTRWSRKQPRGQLGGIVAEVSGQTVGLVLAEVFSPQPNQPLVGEIISLFVLPNYRHQGIGTGLMQNLAKGFKTLDYPASLNPLGETPAEPLNSLGLRYDDQLVGWMVTHRVATDAIRYSTMFVEKRFQRLGRGISLLSQSILRQAENSVPYCLFAVADDNPAMLQFVQRHLQPYLREVTDSRISVKHL